MLSNPADKPSENALSKKALYRQANDLVRLGLSVVRACRAVGLAERTYYFHRRLESENGGHEAKPEESRTNSEPPE